MIRSLLLGAVCLTCSAFAQQYISTGPVPQRPTAFAGAVPVQQQPSARTLTIRQRPVSRTLQQEPAIRSQVTAQQQPSVVRLRRPQNSGRARNFVDDDEFDRKQQIALGNQQGDTYQRPRAPSAPTPIPTSPPVPQTTKYVTPRPAVVPVEEEYSEEEEEEEEGTTPASISRSAYVGPYQPSQPPTPFQRPAFLQPVAFRPAPQPSFQQTPILSTPQSPVIRQFPRPQSQLRPQPQVTPAPVLRQPTPQNSEEDEEPQYQRQQPLRQQNRRPQQQQETEYRPTQEVRQQSVKQQQVYRQHPTKASESGQRERKPVSQTLRKYHEENEDGSITWGYENDDGSFKEETIGVDCVTRGKYGYVDPDGVKREYSYQTGIPCDREAEAEAEQAASANEGYIDYSNNKYVFPNGDEIDLDSMVKNKKRKPVGQYRN